MYITLCMCIYIYAYIYKFVRRGLTSTIKEIQSENEIPLHLLEWLKFKRSIMPSDGVNAEKFEPSFTACGNIK